MKVTKTIKPPKALFSALGNTNYKLNEALSELIDNSISAGVKGKCTNIDINFILGESGTCERIIIRDNASGIPEDDIVKCINLAGKQTKNSLNEHGLGLKSSIAAIGELDYFKTKCSNEAGYLIEEFDWDLVIENECEFSFEHGTEISIDTTNTIYSKMVGKINKKDFKKEINVLSMRLGARYRKKIVKLGELIQINLIVTDELNQDHITEVKVVKPIYYNPWNGTSNALVYNKKFTYNDAVAYLTFGYSPITREDFEKVNVDYELYKDSSNHPYGVSSNNKGLDIIMNDRVIMFAQLKGIDLVRSNHLSQTKIRGEIVLQSGFVTTGNKTDIMRGDNFDNIMDQIHSFLTGISDQEADANKKITGGRYRNLIRNHYLSGDITRGDHERELKKLIAHQLLKKNPMDEQSDIKLDVPYQDLGLKVDMIVDKIPWEIRNDKCTAATIALLAQNMLCVKSKHGVIVASEFSEKALELIKVWGKKGFIIHTKKTNDYYIP